MQLVALGGDLRMNGLLRAARRAGFSCVQVKEEEELTALPERTEAVVLPWPRSFAGGVLSNTQIKQEEVVACMPACDILLAGGGSEALQSRAKAVVSPAQDEAFLVENAKLTAEGAVAALMGGGALMGKTCLITGFGRIAAALTQRLCAMEAFVIVCARSEAQMHRAHQMGAHPVALAQLAAAGAQADVVINTVPSRVFTGEALAQMKPGVRFLELASPPYGADPEQAAKLGVSMEIMGGLPGKYAPEEAGAALFRALERFIQRQEIKKEDA